MEEPDEYRSSLMKAECCAAAITRVGRLRLRISRSTDGKRPQKKIFHISFDISHWPFEIVFRVRSCDFVDRSLRLPNDPRSNTNDHELIQEMTTEKCQMRYGKSTSRSTNPKGTLRLPYRFSISTGSIAAASSNPNTRE